MDGASTDASRMHKKRRTDSEESEAKEADAGRMDKVRSSDAERQCSTAISTDRLGKTGYQSGR